MQGFNHDQTAEEREEMEVEELMYWRDYVLLPLLGFFLTVLVIVASGSIMYPLIGYVIALTIVGAILARQQKEYAKWR